MITQSFALVRCYWLVGVSVGLLGTPSLTYVTVCSNTLSASVLFTSFPDLTVLAGDETTVCVFMRGTSIVVIVDVNSVQIILEIISCGLGPITETTSVKVTPSNAISRVLITTIVTILSSVTDE